MGTATLLISGFELAVIAFAFVTLLGDAWALFVGLAVGYWLGPRFDATTRPAAATVIGVATLALAVVLAVKSSTAIPRPAAMPIDPAGLPGGLAGFVAGELDSAGFSFPSGHATGATAVYGSLAVLLTTGRRRWRYLIAGTATGLISLSRVILEVHYPRDSIAGILLGGLLVAVGAAVARGDDHLRADRVFLLAGIAAGIGVVVAWVGGHAEELRHGMIGVGTALGGGGVWYRYGEQLAGEPAVSIPIAAGGLAVAGGVWIGAYEGVLGLAGALVGGAVGTVIILGLPLIEQWHKKDRNAESA